MKNYTKYLILFFALVAVGCSNFDDMNKNPYALYETNAESFVQPILYNTEKTISSKNYDVLSEIMYSVSCKAAMKAGQKNSPEELIAIAKRVLLSDDIRYCPHGRPVMIEFTKTELEKKFKRIV